MSRLIFAATFALALAMAGGADAKQCRDAKGKFIKCAPVAASTAAPKAPPHCTKGVPCGNTCIARGKTCHKT